MLESLTGIGLSRPFITKFLRELNVREHFHCVPDVNSCTAICVASAEVFLSRGVTLVSGFAVPCNSFIKILWNALTAFVAKAKVEPGGSVPLFGCLTEPVC
jgi:hypothetical protein